MNDAQSMWGPAGRGRGGERAELMERLRHRGRDSPWRSTAGEVAGRDRGLTVGSER